MLQVWSRTYFISLLIGILVIGFITVQWMEYATEQNRIHTIQHITERMAEQVVDMPEEMVPASDIYTLLGNSQKDLAFKKAIRAHMKSAQGSPYPIFPHRQVRGIRGYLSNSGQLWKLEGKDNLKMNLGKQAFP